MGNGILPEEFSIGNGILPVEIFQQEMAFYQWKSSIRNGILPVKILPGNGNGSIGNGILPRGKLFIINGIYQFSMGNGILSVEIIAFIIHLENWIVSAT